MYRTVVVLPTYNEHESLASLIPAIQKSGVDILVVDDSPDDRTKEVANYFNVPVIHRKGKGRMSAIYLGIAKSWQPNIIVMDADGQHPPEVIPNILEALEDYDIVVPSRRVPGGGYERFSNWRKFVSNVANWLAFPLAPKLRDRTSGYVAFRRNVLNRHKMPEGFSTLVLGLLVLGQYRNFTEIPFVFKVRWQGESKLTTSKTLDHLWQLAKLYLTKFTILKFGLVGASGTVLGLGILYTLTDVFGLYYLLSYAISFLTSATSNYMLNSLWTFGEGRKVSSWLKYILIAGMTLTINLGIVYLLTDVLGLWYMLSAGLGVFSAFILNYLLSRWLVWKGGNKHG